MALVKFPDTLLQSLIDGCIALERDSQKRFYTHFYGYAHTVCYRYVSNEEDTLEIVNDGFVKIFRDVSHFKPQFENIEQSLKAWMRRIFINTAIDHLRRQKHKMVLLKEEHEVPAVLHEEMPLQKLSHKELLDTIALLTPAYRTVFNLYVIDGYTHEQIGMLLNISPGTSKSNLAKARINLQKMILNKQKQEADYERKVV